MVFLLNHKLSLEQINIVCYADADWNAPLQTNRQQAMRQLAQRSELIRVLFVEPPIFWFSGNRKRKPVDRSSEKGSQILCKELANLWVLKTPSLLPNRVLRRYGFRLYQYHILTAVKYVQKVLNFTSPVIWTYSPLSVDYLHKIDEILVCYDCVDDHLATPYYQGQTGADVGKLERQLFEQSDLIFFTSEELQARKGVYGKNVHLVGNAADVDLFHSAITQPFRNPDDLVNISHPIIGFFGALVDLKVDFNLLGQIASARPEWSIVLIGPSEDCEGIRALSTLPNIYLLGIKPQTELPYYLKYFDVCMIPYKQNDYTRGIYALKLHEYLAAGKPVVVTDLPFFKDFHDVIYVAKDTSDFISAISTALNENQPLVREERIRIAQQHSWKIKVDKMLNLVIARLQQKGYNIPIEPQV